jgi:hypothetical protein
LLTINAFPVTKAALAKQAACLASVVALPGTDSCDRRSANPQTPSPARLADRGPRAHHLMMFVVSEAEADAIRAAFDRGGELSAAVELRRLFPGVTDTAQAPECARTIAAWKPLPATPGGALGRRAPIIPCRKGE